MLSIFPCLHRRLPLSYSPMIQFSCAREQQLLLKYYALYVAEHMKLVPSKTLKDHKKNCSLQMNCLRMVPDENYKRFLYKIYASQMLTIDVYRKHQTNCLYLITSIHYQ